MLSDNLDEDAEGTPVQEVTRIPGQEYVELQSLIVMMCSSIETLPLKVFLTRIARARAVAPTVDPVLYRDGAAVLARVERLAKALLTAQEEIKKVHEELDAEVGRVS